MRVFSAAKVAAVALMCAVSLFGGQLFQNPYGGDSGDQHNEYRYEGISGAKYKYDLSNPSDRIEYSTDVDAQMQDSLSVSPNRNLDRSFGQFGGGIDPND